MLHRYYQLAPNARLVSNGQGPWIVCDYPLQKHLLNESAFLLLDALDGKTSLRDLVGPRLEDALHYLEKLERSGALVCRYEAEPRPKNNDAGLPIVEVIIPVLENIIGLKRCLKALGKQTYPFHLFSVTVVDDGSPLEIREALEHQIDCSFPIRWVRHPTNLGPASARNLGAKHLDFPQQENCFGSDGESGLMEGGSGRRADIFAFTDSDCLPEPEWLSQMVSVMENQEIHAVGGQVLGLHETGWLARYEGECSSLNMGRTPMPAGLPSGRVPYLPACNLAVREKVFFAVKGFSEGWRLGEDVDFCWRLSAGGFRLFYFPGAAVRHDHRLSFWAFFKRRAQYATTEHDLNQRRKKYFPNATISFNSLAFGSVLIAIAAWPIGLPWLIGFLGLPWIAALWRSVFYPQVSLPFYIRVVAGCRMALAGLMLVSRLLFHRGLIVCIPVVGLWPETSVGFAGIWLLAMIGEWLVRRPRLFPGDFLLGYGLDCLAYSPGFLWGYVKTQGQRLLNRRLDDFPNGETKFEE